MKEATGELNATVVVVVAVGVLAAFFFFTLWPMIRSNYEKNANCDNAICDTEDNNHDGMVKCHLKGKTEEFQCVYKG